MNPLQRYLFRKLYPDFWEDMVEIQRQSEKREARNQAQGRMITRLENGYAALRTEVESLRRSNGQYKSRRKAVSP